ncbi:hypothetical protein BLNAU_11937 [Blattamonas nauphoetae]|uniref:Uncharacterized protein n=1 Tax=Blattamonas nauphoetae TaxID=2049346 RepID=A0ABQ9XL45_9EUKA|nr:hypothetical protein BLNAU_11937 [Blattamonas nauphoetae]
MLDHPTSLVSVTVTETSRPMSDSPLVSSLTRSAVIKQVALACATSYLSTLCVSIMNPHTGSVASYDLMADTITEQINIASSSKNINISRKFSTAVSVVFPAVLSHNVLDSIQSYIPTLTMINPLINIHINSDITPMAAFSAACEPDPTLHFSTRCDRIMQFFDSSSDDLFDVVMKSSPPFQPISLTSLLRTTNNIACSVDFGIVLSSSTTSAITRSCIFLSDDLPNALPPVKMNQRYAPVDITLIVSLNGLSALAMGLAGYCVSLFENSVCPETIFKDILTQILGGQSPLLSDVLSIKFSDSTRQAVTQLLSSPLPRGESALGVNFTGYIVEESSTAVRKPNRVNVEPTEVLSEDDDNDAMETADLFDLVHNLPISPQMSTLSSSLNIQSQLPQILQQISTSPDSNDVPAASTPRVLDQLKQRASLFVSVNVNLSNFDTTQPFITHPLTFSSFDTVCQDLFKSSLVILKDRNPELFLSGNERRELLDRTVFLPSLIQSVCTIIQNGRNEGTIDSLLELTTGGSVDEETLFAPLSLKVDRIREETLRRMEDLSLEWLNTATLKTARKRKQDQEPITKKKRVRSSHSEDDDVIDTRTERKKKIKKQKRTPSRRVGEKDKQQFHQSTLSSDEQTETGLLSSSSQNDIDDHFLRDLEFGSCDDPTQLLDSYSDLTIRDHEE